MLRRRIKNLLKNFTSPIALVVMDLLEVVISNVGLNQALVTSVLYLLQYHAQET
jgi:hypothetical protein